MISKICMGFKYITIYISWFFLIFFSSYSSFNTLSNMVQASVQYYPGLVKTRKNSNLNNFYTLKGT
jgi:hypothetical protein